MSSEEIIWLGTKIIVVITILVASYAIFLIIRDKKLKPIKERRERLKNERNRIYFDQCLLHLKNGDIGIFEGVSSLITDKNLQDTLNFVYLGMNLNSDKKRVQNKAIKNIKEIVDNQKLYSIFKFK